MVNVLGRLSPILSGGGPPGLDGTRWRGRPWRLGPGPVGKTPDGRAAAEGTSNANPAARSGRKRGPGSRRVRFEAADLVLFLRVRGPQWRSFGNSSAEELQAFEFLDGEAVP